METGKKRAKLVRKRKVGEPRDIVEEYRQLQKQEELLDTEITELESKGVTVDLKPQMEALHQYNDMKDAAQRVLGYIANVEQITVAEIHKRFNVPID